VVSVGALVLVDALNGESLDRLEMRALARGNDDSGLETLGLRLCRTEGKENAVSGVYLSSTEL